MVDKKIDILIAGGGLTGATLLLGLQNLGYACMLVESRPLSDKIDPDFDARTLALAPASMRLFQSLNLWSEMKQHATAIESIHVSEAGCFGATRLKAEREEALGYVMEMQHLNQVLMKHMPINQVQAPATLISLDTENHIAHIKTQDTTKVIQAQLIIAADGADSSLRRFCALPSETKSYNQCAIIANIALENPHRGQAFERFTKQGALALLPMAQQRMALVWSLNTQEAEHYMRMSDAEFMKTVHAAFGYRLGKMLKPGKRSIFPLRQVIMPKQVAFPLVFIGNAAHTLHPVAAQGFNLGLRDVATLIQCITEQGLTPDMLASYQQRRMQDQQVITKSTDILAELFTLPVPGLQFARNAGLIALDNMPFLKQIFSRYARGFGGYVPDLLCNFTPFKRDNHE